MTHAWLVRRCGHAAFLTAVLLLVVATGVWSAAVEYPAFPDGDAGGAVRQSEPVPVHSYRVVAMHPHDPAAFTQGLVYADEVFYEGTGLHGRSSLRRVDPPTGQVQQKVDLAPSYFGEGVALVGDTLYQLTWKEHTALAYDRRSFAAAGQFTYTTEGWGLTYDGRSLIMSDGSNILYFRDPVTFEETGRVQVFDGARPVTLLNELEFIDGEVYANVWQTDCIARIDPQTGRVTAWIDLAGLRPPQTDVLNGIAYDAGQGRLFVTGKLWPHLYEIALVPRSTTFMPLVCRG